MASDPSSKDDPFAQLDGHRTFIRPTPGGWAGARTTEGTSAGTGSGAEAQAVPEHGLNPLLAVANKRLGTVKMGASR